MKRLQQLLEDYRSGGSFPTYKQLAEIAYGNPLGHEENVRRFFARIRTPETGPYSGNNPSICITDEGDQNAPQTKSR